MGAAMGRGDPPEEPPGSLSLGLAEPFGLAGFGAGFLAAMAAQLLIAGGSSVPPEEARS